MTTIGLVFCCTFLVLIRNVYSQGIASTADQEVRSCDANSRCVTLRRCPAASGSGGGRNRDRRICGYTLGERRRPKICCSDLAGRTPAVANGPNINVAGCGLARDAPDAGFVKGGKRAKPGAWPWMVAIQMANQYGRQAPLCTGFLITTKHVLTAAHCMEDPQASLYELRIGNVDLRKGRPYTIQTIKVHEGYQPGTYYDDIALLTLTKDADEPDVNAICLPFGRLARKNLTGLGTTVAGWGSEEFGGLMSNHLLYLEGMPVVSNKECNRIFNSKLRGFDRQFPKGVTPGFMCAGYLEGGKDSCGGDSGGPLMLLRTTKWYAVGIVSFGHDCGTPGFPGGYTRISYYLDWIQKNLS